MAGGDYGRIRHTFWTDPDIKRALSPEQKVLLLYYFTSPHRTLVGLYYCPLEYAASETGLPLERVREWTDGALSQFVTYDHTTEEILVHRAGRHQVGDELKAADNQCKAIVKALSEAHSPTLVRKFLDLYRHWPIAFKAPSDKTDPPSEPLASPSEAKAVAVTEQKHELPGSKEPDGEPSNDEGRTDPETVWKQSHRDIAGAIRKYAWLDGDPPHVQSANGRRWGMQNELSIAKELLKQYTPEELIGGLEFWRSVHATPEGEQFSLAFAYKEGQRWRIDLPVNAWQHREEDGAPVVDLVAKLRMGSRDAA